ncbi:pyocin activator PrtN family protein [Pseudomonas sp. NMI795_08]|uniref:pyocin activator PrtN family protein n=1 Tax=Pseudomonas sp. NMI795_08 TaxID=2903144 RepID=UPI001E300B37|nr:pyocin activator PrtN family protein [Pseudomonas sp. NMI795_08]MCE1117475.1 pyocin activator PrtN family protein [Pseudomonas sp. NMI795_08]
MKTAFILMAPYNGLAVMLQRRVCADYFPHLSSTKMKIKIICGEIRLPLIAMKRRQKPSHGLHVVDLEAYIDVRCAEAQKGM